MQSLVKNNSNNNNQKIITIIWVLIITRDYANSFLNIYKSSQKPEMQY